MNSVSIILVTHLFNSLCRRSGGPGLGAPQLRGLALLNGLLRLADGRGAGDGVLAEVGAVVAVRGRVDDGLVGLAGSPVGTDGGLRDVRCGLVTLSGLLGQEDNATLRSGLDTDGLANVSISYSWYIALRLFVRWLEFVECTLSSTRPSYCAQLADCHTFVDVDAHLALVRVLQVEGIARERNTASLCPLHEGRATLLLGDFPKEVGGESGHCCGCLCRCIVNVEVAMLWCGSSSSKFAYRAATGKALSGGKNAVSACTDAADDCAAPGATIMLPLLSNARRADA